MRKKIERIARQIREAARELEGGEVFSKRKTADFDEDEWYEAGWENSELAKAWWNAGFNPYEANEWWKAGVRDPEDARRREEQGETPY